MLFVDRERELRVLEEVYGSGRPELVVVYGRRRLGKTFLVRRFMRGRRGLYLVVNYSDRGLALLDLSRQVGLELGVRARFEWFSDLLVFASRLLQPRPLIVVDEFQRLAGTGLLSELQSFWDRWSHELNPVVVLVGSGVGVVERVALSYNSPIYGRVTRVLRVVGFGYREARVFMGRWSPEDRVRGYSVFGGTPHYLSMVDDRESLEENILRLVLEPGGPLHEEPLVILWAETREPDRYVAILEAIASGRARLSEISAYTGIPREQLPKYLSVLEEGLGLVERVYPLGMEGRPRYARYRVTDLFFDFWFSVVHANRGLIERDPRGALGRVMGAVELRAGRVWERVAEEHMLLLRERGELSFDRIGGWWWKGTEIDIVAVDEKSSTVYFVECKWGEADSHTLARLRAKAQAFPWRRGERREVYIIYARRVRGLAGEPNTLVYTLEDVEEDFEASRPRVETLD